MGSTFLVLGLLWQDRVDVRQHSDASLHNGDSPEQFVELLVVADRELDSAGHYAGLLVVAHSVVGERENLGREYLASKMDGSIYASTSRMDQYTRVPRVC